MKFKLVEEKSNIEEHSTRGVVNGFGHLSSQIWYDRSKEILSSDNLNEAIEFEVPRDRLGGIIVLSTDVNAIVLDPNKLKNWIKQKWETLKNRLIYSRKIKKKADSYSDILAWTIGKYLHGLYKSNSGIIFDENSISIELLNVPSSTIISFAEDLCKDFIQETVLVKLYGEDRILFVSSRK